MLYLGIDIGKNTHIASLLDEKAKPLFRAFSFSNTTVGAISLLEKLSVLMKLKSDGSNGTLLTICDG